MPFLLAQQEPPAGPPPDAQPGWVTFVPFALMGLVIWFMLIRPQQKQEKERKSRVEALKKGDKVRTRGGIVAPVLKVKEDEVIVGIGGDKSIELSVHKAFIDEVYAAGGKPDAAGK